MDKAQLESLKATAEQDCNRLFQQINDLQVELERKRGDFRTYESLLLSWEDKPLEGEVLPPENEGGMVMQDDKSGKAKEQPK
jgi:hypothetical protein